jgi:hypothetical protein
MSKIRPNKSKRKNKSTPSFARLAYSISPPEIIDIERPFSNFRFIENRFGGISTLRRIMSQIRQHGGKTLVLEQLKETNDLLEENQDIQIRNPNFTPIGAWRLSFFTKRFKTQRGLHSVTGDEFLGYTIIKKDDLPEPAIGTRVYESVIRASRHVNNFIKCHRKWPCRVAGNTFQVEGTLYAQQNNITNVCAHVALRTAMGPFHKNGDMTYREMNKVIGIDHKNRQLGTGSGLDNLEMIRILEFAGARCFPASYRNTGNATEIIPFQKVLYGSIESGFPAIVIFQTAFNPDICHAIPVLGHTFNEDTWVYRAEASYFKVGTQTLYIPSESWVSMYIAHDDNWGSNFCIPRRYLHTRRFCTQFPGKGRPCSMDIGCVLYVIGTLPQEAAMNALQAEVIGADYLFTILPKMPDIPEEWLNRLVYYATNHQLILRPILIKGKDYCQHLRKVRDWQNNALGFNLHLGDDQESWLWLVELSIPELFPSNRRKVAEVLLKASIRPKPTRDFGNFLCARVPGYFALYKSGPSTNPVYEFIPCGLKSHTELYGCEDNR